MSICAFYMPTEGKRNFNLQTKSNGKNKLKKASREKYTYQK